jgi:hypothetical protein
MTNVHFRAETHAMTRLDVSTGMTYDEFRAAFEGAAPPFDIVGVYLADGGGWDDARPRSPITQGDEAFFYCQRQRELRGRCRRSDSMRSGGRGRVVPSGGLGAFTGEFLGDRQTDTPPMASAFRRSWR